MSEPPLSSPVPSGYPPGHPPLPPRYRPSGWWFAVGGGLIVAALVAAVGLFVWTISPLIVPGAEVPADGQSHIVIVDTDDELMLWRDSDVFDPGCSIVDVTNGDEVDLRPVTSQITKDLGDGELTAAYRFDPGSGTLDITCAAADDSVIEIGPAPQVGTVLGGIIATIAVPTLLGLFGLAILIVNGVLWSTRPARPKGVSPA